MARSKNLKTRKKYKIERMDSWERRKAIKQLHFDASVTLDDVVSIVRKEFPKITPDLVGIRGDISQLGGFYVFRTDEVDKVSIGGC